MQQVAQHWCNKFIFTCWYYRYRLCNLLCNRIATISCITSINKE